MLLRHVAIVSESDNVNAADVSIAAAAIQKQVTRDFGPIWEIDATVDGFDALEDVPIDYWPVIIEDNINEPGAAGVHKDDNGQPFALVQASEGWQLTTSHECLEMLADPFGNRLVAGQSPMQDQGRVEFLVEVCDPPEDAQFAYTSNGILVSDFLTPYYYDPVTSSSVRYSYTGAIQAPRTVLQGGYLSWHDPVSDHWFQERFFDAESEFVDVGVLTAAESLRSEIDRRTIVPQRQKGLPKTAPFVRKANAMRAAASSSGSSRASRLHNRIEEVRRAAGDR
ncbi:MAG: hypothetical protein DMG88_13130 [Acidobacteria bacterium]|nr:MAG: hypothetical protein DMG88_13130 [Acidobacteriota bacterium]